MSRATPLGLLALTAGLLSAPIAHANSLPKYENGAWRFDGDAIDRVEVSVPAGQLDVGRADRDAVGARIGRIDGPATCQVHMRVDDRVLYVVAGEPMQTRFIRCRSTLALEVPDSVEVGLRVAFGQVHLRDVGAPLSVWGRGVDVRGSTHAPRVEVTSRSGDIQLRGLVAAPITHTTTGRIVLRFDRVPRGTIVASADPERVRVVLPRGGEARVVHDLTPEPPVGGHGGTLIRTAEQP